MPNIKIPYRGYVTRSVQYMGMNGQKEQWNLLDCLERDSSIF